MINPSDVLVVTTEAIPGFRVVAMLGEATGCTSRSNHGSVAAFSSSLKPVSQGELVHYTKTVEETKDWRVYVKKPQKKGQMQFCL